jgi:hypothetical protein
LKKAFAQGFLQRTLQSAHCNQSGGLGDMSVVPHVNGTIVLLNTAQMEKYAQPLAFGA